MNVSYQRYKLLKRFFTNRCLLINIQRQCYGVNLWQEDLSVSIKHKVEKHWSAKSELRIDNKNREKYYVLSMFPYPSGQLHMGHVRVYTISDCIARFQRMNGKNVIHPIGWDAFGLPAENAAIDQNVPPETWTKQNISQMKQQLKQLGISFDWNREISTCDPKYYKWTQSIFLKLFKSGLVYQKKALVNWDPVDQTVLADEQVNENGCSWRSGAKVEKKLLTQWFIRTTKFAKQLLVGLNDSSLQDWRDIIKLQQHWIGECNGVSFDFKLNNSSVLDFLTVWTCKPEYLSKVKFIAINNDNMLAHENGQELIEGVKLLDIKAINFLTGEEIPIFVTNRIEFSVGIDSYIGIPDYKEEDREFAQLVNISFKQGKENFIEDSKIALQEEVCKKAKKLKQGGYWSSEKLKDWLISRQRYWGTPIPIIHCKSCGAQPVPESELPVELPELKSISKRGGQLLAECTDWLNARCPKCKGVAKREADTMDTFVDSSWYYLRYLDPNNENEPFSKNKARELMPVDLYIGGKEHAVLHLYYARFLNHFLESIGMVSNREPFKRLLVQGMVMGRSFRIKGTGQYIPESKVNVINLKKNKAECKETKQPVIIAWEKMSKSKYNGVSPSAMFEEYGIDTTRLLILADVAPTSHRNWNSNTFPGILGWQHRLWITIRDFIKCRNNISDLKPIEDAKKEEEDDYMFDSRNYYIKGTTFNYCQSQQISVAVSKMQGLTNSLRKISPYTMAKSQQFERALATLIIMLAPMAPHFASELWSGFQSAPNRLILENNEEIDWDKSVLQQKWPQVDLGYKLDLVFKINGFEHSIIKIARREIEMLSYDEVIEIAKKQFDLQNLLKKYTIKNIHYDMYPGYEGVLHYITSATWKQLNSDIGTEK